MIPGWHGSGPEHWQSRWERELGFVRVEMPDWDQPRRDAWVAALVAAVRAAAGPVVLVAHSLGCLAVSHAAPQLGARVRGALLVAPPDVEREACPDAVRDFGPVPRVGLPFPALLVASDNDIYAELAWMAGLARAWGAELVEIPGAGHLNTASGHGSWEAGRALLARVAPTAPR